MGPTALARETGQTKQDISRWADGSRELTAPLAQKIAPALNVPWQQIVHRSDEHIESSDVAAQQEAPRRREVPIVGYVGAGAERHHYNVDHGYLELIDAPDGANLSTVALEIRGTSLGEAFDRWLLFYNDVRSPVTTDQIGELCVVGLADDRILVKTIRPDRKGGYILTSHTEPPIDDAEILWAAKVIAMKPRR